MSPMQRWLLSIACLIVAPAGGARGGPPRADRFGDPLPAGAVVRLGTTRLRHNHSIKTLALSPDGKLVASGSLLEGILRLWRAADGKMVRQLLTVESIHHVAFAPDGKTLAASFSALPKGSGWELPTGEPLGLLTDSGHNRKLQFSPDGRTLAVYGSPNPILLYEVASGAGRLRLPGKAPFAFAPDGKTLAASEGRTTALIWDVTGLLRDEGERKELRLSSAELQAGKPSLELRRRVNRLLELLRWPVRSPRMLRELRAVEVLEHVGTPQAKQLLDTLARGAPQACLTREAKIALRHLARGRGGVR